MANVFDFYVCADESGLHASPTYSLIAGYIGRPSPWVRFERRWERVLKQYDVRDFHAKDYFAFASGGKRMGKYHRLSNGKKARYGDWSEDQHASFIAGLLKVIGQRDVQPVSIAVRMAAWNDLAYGEKRFLTGGHIEKATGKWISTGAPSKVYFFLFQHFLAETLKRAKRGQRVLFVFDDHKSYKSRALQLCKEAVQLEPQVMSAFGGVGFVPRQEAPGLQAADLYAHCWHRYFTNPDKMGDARSNAMAVLAARDRDMSYYDSRGLESLLVQLPDDVREKLRRHRKPEKGTHGD